MIASLFRGLETLYFRGSIEASALRQEKERVCVCVCECVCVCVCMCVYVRGRSA